MSIQFSKMQGLGNDFVVVDAVSQPIQITSRLAQQIADRRYGVGCDQVLIVGPSENNLADFSYRIFNADGSEVAQCGNGARCVGRFIEAKALSAKKSIKLATLNRLLQVDLIDDKHVRVEIGVPDFNPISLPLMVDQVAQRNSTYQLQIGEESFDFGAVSVGNPHVVSFVSEINLSKITKLGEELNHHDAFPEGVNVGFVQVSLPDKIELTVFERGAGLTQACGSGACAAVVIGRAQGYLESSVQVVQRGGTLQVDWQGPGESIFLTGPAEFVFDGVWP